MLCRINTIILYHVIKYGIMNTIDMHIRLLPMPRDEVCEVMYAVRRQEVDRNMHIKVAPVNDE